jgi:hypothetical protein
MARVMGETRVGEDKRETPKQSRALIYANTKLACHVILYVNTIPNTSHLLAVMNIPL